MIAGPRLALPLLGSALLAAGCGGSREASGESSGARVEEPSASGRASLDSSTHKPAPKERKPVDPATTGTIHGVVTFEGSPPARKPMEIGGVSGCPHQDPAPLTEDVVVSDGRLANV